MSAVVEVSGVHKTYRSRHGSTRAVQDLSLVIGGRETLGVIGESGSGKSTIGRIALGLEPPDEGQVRFCGQDVYGSGSSEWRRLVSVVLQEPEQALNPRMTIGAAVAEPLLVHERGLSRSSRRKRVENALRQAHLDPVIADRYPRELSGGQQQRVSIARAIITEPRFIVLDEPTASLDLSVRGRILDTLEELQDSLDIAYLLISHDMETIRRLAHRTMVLYRGCVMESGTTEAVTGDPVHPYTRALLAAVLSVQPGRRAGTFRLRSAQLLLSDAREEGCVLRGRCPDEAGQCSGSDVPLRRYGDREIACVHPPDGGIALVGREGVEASTPGTDVP